MIVTIIICTRNRSNLLQKCLTSLVISSRQKKDVEILIVDNCSTDDTRKVATAYINVNKCAHYVLEDKLGLSYSRNQGLKKAKGKYVAYIDDDAIADPDWVSNIISFIKNNPKVKAFGGPYSYYTLNKPQAWFPVEEFILSHGQKTKKLSTKKGEFLSGTNMIYSKSILKKMDGFNVNLGMSGKKVGYGEETELQKRINDSGTPIHYIPSIRVKHLIAKHKQNLGWLVKDSFSRGVSQSIFERPSSLSVVYSLCVNLFKSIYLLAIPKKGNGQFWQRRIYFAFRPLLTEIGYIWGKISQ